MDTLITPTLYTTPISWVEQLPFLNSTMMSTTTNITRIFGDSYSNNLNAPDRNSNVFRLSYIDVEESDEVVNESSRMTTHYNTSQSLYTQVIIVLMYVLIIVIAVGGNLLFAYIIVLRQKIWSVTNLFLLNVAVSDVLKALICNPFSFMANLILMYWPFGEFMCPLVTYVQGVTVFLSAFTLVAMSVDRYLAILRPMRHKMSKTAFAITMGVIWAVSLATPLPTAITSRIQYFPNESVGLCLEVFEDKSHRTIYGVMLMVLQYFLPLAVITVTNVHIGFIVWIKKPPGEAEQDRDQRLAASKRRLLKMIIICVVIYAICWLPLHTITLMGDMNPDIYNLPYMNIIWIFAHWLAMSHSCYNPIVYFSLNANFRRNLKYLCLFCRNRHKRLHYSMTMRMSKRNTSVIKRRSNQQDAATRSYFSHVTRYPPALSGRMSTKSQTSFVSLSPKQHYLDNCY